MLYTVNLNSAFINHDIPASNKHCCSFSNWFNFQISDRFNGAWYAIKDLIKEPTELGKLIRAVATQGYQSVDEGTLIEAFASKEYPQLIFFISKVFNQMSDRQLNDFIKGLFNAHGIANSPILIGKLRGLLTLQKIEGVIRTEFPLFQSTQEVVAEIKEFGKGERKVRELEHQRSFRATALVYLHKGIEFVLNILIYLTHLKQFLPGEQAEYFDPYTRDMAYQNFISNLAVFSGWMISLTLMTGSVTLASLILGGGLVSLLAISYIYIKYFKPPPEEVPESTNLTKLAYKGQLPKVYGRDEEIRALVDILCSNNETTRKHPILTGQTRVGKTEIVKGLVHYLNSPDAEPELRGKIVLHINAGDLSYESSINKILDAVLGHESKYIFFFDEFHSIFSNSKANLKNRFKTLLDPGKRGLPYCIFATTKKEFNQTIFQEDAILARLVEILVKPLEEGEIFPVLKRMVRRDAPDLIVDQAAIQAIANVHKEHAAYESCSQPFTSKVILSQILAKTRNEISVEKESELRDLKSQKIVVESSEESHQPSTFLFSQEGAERKRKISEINQRIQELEKEMNGSKRRIKKFLNTVLKCNQLREKIVDKAFQLPAKPSEGELQEFILEYTYLQTAYHQKIAKYRHKYPRSIVNLERAQQHIAEEIAKKRGIEASN